MYKRQVENFYSGGKLINEYNDFIPSESNAKIYSKFEKFQDKLENIRISYSSYDSDFEDDSFSINE